ncbi:uncharacterized protein FOMMEDRAFT_31326 [Fomitiporia mediterranea MF3/22]|uniref:uncharacterized protein n=1 Tax=Fomitiporia mediterranea (strain MF3/22) TaxID=694068 RepID=UPI000440918E|nr:uncharacterized protein FOMMEDRAFT_31326 [Fomitiporia mediterranea MF3/22]EJC99253.1 hypothetical protein FOMMEDRAFT_31326 [Fomitiporia mediterranea MF3/22]
MSGGSKKESSPGNDHGVESVPDKLEFDRAVTAFLLVSAKLQRRLSSDLYRKAGPAQSIPRVLQMGRRTAIAALEELQKGEATLYDTQGRSTEVRHKRLSRIGSEFVEKVQAERRKELANIMHGEFTISYHAVCQDVDDEKLLKTALTHTFDLIAGGSVSDVSLAVVYWCKALAEEMVAFEIYNPNYKRIVELQKRLHKLDAIVSQEKGKANKLWSESSSEWSDSDDGIYSRQKHKISIEKGSIQIPDLQEVNNAAIEVSHIDYEVEQLRKSRWSARSEARAMYKRNDVLEEIEGIANRMQQGPSAKSTTSDKARRLVTSVTSIGARHNSATCGDITHSLHKMDKQAHDTEKVLMHGLTALITALRRLQEKEDGIFKELQDTEDNEKVKAWLPSHEDIYNIVEGVRTGFTDEYDGVADEVKKTIDRSLYVMKYGSFTDWAKAVHYWCKAFEAQVEVCNTYARFRSQVSSLNKASNNHIGTSAKGHQESKEDGSKKEHGKERQVSRSDSSSKDRMAQELRRQIKAELKRPEERVKKALRAIEGLSKETEQKIKGQQRVPRRFLTISSKTGVASSTRGSETNDTSISGRGETGSTKGSNKKEWM